MLLNHLKVRVEIVLELWQHRLLLTCRLLLRIERLKKDILTRGAAVGLGGPSSSSTIATTAMVPLIRDSLTGARSRIHMVQKVYVAL